MAGDWIKIEHTTPDKPEVDALAAALKLDHDSVVGKLVRLWIWADQNSINGNDVSVTFSLIDRVTYCPGFAAGLVKVGWLDGRESCFSFPNFDRHNGQTSKNRSVTNRRVARFRKSHATNGPLPKALPEESRGECFISTYSNAGDVCQSARNVDEVLELMKGVSPCPAGDELQRCAESFFDELSAIGWRNKKGVSLTDWRPLARKYATSWARNNAADVSARAGRKQSSSNRNEGTANKQQGRYKL